VHVSIRGLLLLVAPPVIGVVVGYLLGGRLSGFRMIRFVALWLVWLAALVQVMQYYVIDVRDFIEQRLGVPMLGIVFVLVLTWLAVNLRHWPVAIRFAGLVIVLGALLNGLVIALNGRMPYRSTTATAVGLQQGLTTPKNEPADSGTRLAFLGDTIPIAVLHTMVSPGDILIGCGSAAMVVFAMRRQRGTAPDLLPQIVTGD
jgi:hypothetical protein